MDRRVMIPKSIIEKYPVPCPFCHTTGMRGLFSCLRCEGMGWLSREKAFSLGLEIDPYITRDQLNGGIDVSRLSEQQKKQLIEAQKVVDAIHPALRGLLVLDHGGK